MCGLVGMVTKHRNGFNTGNLDAFELMMFMDQLRGMDSTGAFCVSNIGNVSIAKEASHATDYLQQAGWKSLRTEAIRDGWAMVGHNRKATRGLINDVNAHPFWVEDKMVLVHNGTMWGDHKKHVDVEVDSHAIAHLIVEEEDVEKAMQKIHAAYALIWYEVQKKQLNFLRNDQRPLFWCDTSDAWYVCSDPDYMLFALMKTNQTILQKPQTFNVAELNTWELNTDKSTKITQRELDTTFKSPAANAPAMGVVPFQQLPFKPHPLSNAYWPAGDDIDEQDAAELHERAATEDGVEIPPQPELLRLRELGERIANEAIAKANKEPLVQIETKNIPDWTSKNTYGQWLKARVKYNQQRVRVVCMDYLANDAGIDKVYMCGKTDDDESIYTIFPIHKRLFEAITDPKSPARQEKKAVFSVIVNGVQWKRTEKGKDDTERNMNEWKGLITLSANEAKLYTGPEGTRLQ